MNFKKYAQLFLLVLALSLCFSCIVKAGDSNHLLQNRILSGLVPFETPLQQNLDLSSNPNIQVALEVLKPYNTDNFSLDTLIHHQNSQVAKAAAFLRQFYLYILYSSDTGITQPQPIFHTTDQTYPESHIS